MKVVAVFNRDGGTFRTADMQNFCALARGAFEANGHVIDIRVSEGKSIVGTLKSAVGEQPDVLVAGGGDGTISAAAAHCWRSGVALGIVPAGTMNLFARTLAIPANAEASLPALASGEIRAVDIATANGIPFVHQFSVGLHARMVRMREAMQYRSRAGKIAASTRALINTLLDPPQFPVTYRLGEEKGMMFTASTISISNNPFGEGHLPYADDPAQGVLGVYLHPAMSVGESFSFALNAARGRLGEIPNLEASTSRTVRLEFPMRRKSSLAIIDGEQHPLDRIVEIESKPGQLRVLAPLPAEQPAPSK